MCIRDRPSSGRRPELEQQWLCHCSNCPSNVTSFWQQEWERRPRRGASFGADGFWVLFPTTCQALKTSMARKWVHWQHQKSPRRPVIWKCWYVGWVGAGQDSGHAAAYRWEAGRVGGITGGYFAGDWFLAGVAIWLDGCCAGALLPAVDLGFF